MPPERSTTSSSASNFSSTRSAHGSQRSNGAIISPEASTALIWASSINSAPTSKSVGLCRSAGFYDAATSKTITVYLSVRGFKESGKSAWVEKLEAKDFDQILVTKNVTELGGLKKCKVELYSWFSWMQSDEKQAMLEINRKAYDSYLRSIIVSKSQIINPVPKTNIDGTPLYLGSRVCLDSPNSLPCDYYEWGEGNFNVSYGYIQRESATRGVNPGDSDTAQELVRMAGIPPYEI